ncbi:RNA cap guanine-N2 methyltransferase-domain-containing protein [Trametes maxima]|nr:RNA cap guanine-N2 methyltransferase-domain-containing protein [Trametes maxima]
MGKRKNNISGLSRFLLEAKGEESSTQPDPLPEYERSSLNKPCEELGEISALQQHGTSPDALEARPAKKPRLQTGLLGSGLEKYDATGLVPFYTEESQVPENLQKCKQDSGEPSDVLVIHARRVVDFSQRERFFSLYSSGCLLDEEGWYSVTPERVADQIAERCRCDVILDAFCGVGGNAIAFARTCERVIALDVSPIRLALARHNAALYGVQDRIEFILGDFLSFAQTLQSFSQPNRHVTKNRRRKIDVVFLSPPWGGPSYIAGSPTKPSAASASLGGDDAVINAHAEFNLSRIRPIHGRDLFEVARGITNNVAYFLPRNTSLAEISDLLPQSPTEGSTPERIEVEEEWMGSKLKALTCYFGGLVAGQEARFDG